MIRAWLDLLIYRSLMRYCRTCGQRHPTFIGHLYGLEGHRRRRHSR